MTISNGQPVNETTDNAAFMSRTATNTDTVAQIDLLNVATTNLIGLQRVINELAASLGVANQAATDAAANDYSSNEVVTNGDDRKAAIGKLDAEFNDTTGHNHDGTAGQGAPVSASNLADYNDLFAEFQELTFDAASGTSIDVSTDFSGATPGGDANNAGVITSPPNNFCPILEKDNGGEIEDGSGRRVFGRLTESAGTWTLSFFINDAGTETAHSLSSQDIRFLYREVFTSANRPTIGANVAVYDSLSVVGDIPDADATTRGLVSTSAQTWAGVKDFTSAPTINGNPIPDTTSVQAFSNKTLDSTNTFSGEVVDPVRLDVKKDTLTNLQTYATTATDGQLVFATDTQELFQVVSNALAPVGGGGGLGGSLDNFYQEDFSDTDASDLASGNSATPFASGTLDGTLADNTTGSISNSKDVTYTQGASSVDDWFGSQVIALDPKQQDAFIGATLYTEYDGNDGDIIGFLWDDTNGNVINGTQFDVVGGSSLTRISLAGNTEASTANIRWGFQTVVSNNGAVLQFDSIELSTNPFVVKELVNIDQWIDYTPGISGFGSFSGLTASYKRVGDSLFGRISFQGGTLNGSTAATSYVELPSGLNIDTLKEDDRLCGSFGIEGTDNYVPMVIDTSLSTGRLYFGGTTNITQPSAITSFGSSNQLVSMEFGPIAIEGWNDETEHVITPTSQSVTTEQFLTSTISSTQDAADLQFNNLNVGQQYLITGVLAYDVPSSGTVRAEFYSGAGATGTLYGRSALNGGNATGNNESPAILFTAESETLYTRVTSSGGNLLGGGTKTSTFLQLTNVTRQFLAALPQPPSLMYRSDNGQSAVNNGALEFEDLVYDTRQAYNSSTGVFTPPEGGKYQVNCHVRTANAGTSSAGNFFALRANQTGSVTRSYFGSFDYSASTTTRNYSSQMAVCIEMEAGDELTIDLSMNVNATTLITNADSNHLSIFKIGN